MSSVLPLSLLAPASNVASAVVMSSSLLLVVFSFMVKTWSAKATCLTGDDLPRAMANGDMFNPERLKTLSLFGEAELLRRRSSLGGGGGRIMVSLTASMLLCNPGEVKAVEAEVGVVVAAVAVVVRLMQTSPTLSC